MSREPSYWWDFVDDENAVIVQSDQTGGDCLAKCSSSEEAEAIIEDLKSGRLTIKTLAQTKEKKNDSFNL